MCLPLVLTIALLAHRLAGRGPTWSLPVAHGLAAVALFAVIFEVVLPTVAAGATADPWDAAFYFGGWLFFQAVINAPAAAVPAVRLT